MASAAPRQCQNPTETAFNLCANGAIQETLKCFFCEKFLSVAPIYSDDQQLICGRCKFVNKSDDSKWARQTLYENIAKFLIFPCSNVTYGCAAQLSWGEVEDHESTCLYKKMNCPIFNADISNTEKCRWTGSGPRLNEHLESCHSDLIKKLPEINFSEAKSSCIFLTRVLKQLMIVVIRFENPEIFSCLVMINGASASCDSYRYQLELYDENKKNSVILRRTKLEDAVALEENLINPDRNIVVDLSIIKYLLKDPQVILGRFGIIKKAKKETTHNDSKGHISECVSDENFFRELECPICKNYMLPPIHICTMGHSFCQKCQEQMDECPTCRYSFEGGRNYTLEKLTSCIVYPCVYKDAGCGVACPIDKLTEHELDCSFSGLQCFFECSSSPITNMFKHLNEKHHKKIIVAGELHILDLHANGDGGVEGCLKYFAVCFGNDIFRLTVFYDEDIKFSLQQFGVKSSSYKFELEIICSTGWIARIIMGTECQPLSGDLWKKCVYVPEDVIEKFISQENLIFFKVHLKKMP